MNNDEKFHKMFSTIFDALILYQIFAFVAGLFVLVLIIIAVRKFFLARQSANEETEQQPQTKAAKSGKRGMISAILLMTIALAIGAAVYYPYLRVIF